MTRRRLFGAALLLVLMTAAVASPQETECLIYPEMTVAIAPPIEGVLDKVLVDRGDIVRPGQVVATMESSVEHASVEVAKARSEKQGPLKSGTIRQDFGERRYVRTLEMFNKELIPLKEMDEAETSKLLAEVEVLEANEDNRLARLELGRAQAVLNLRTIKTPISGVVVERLLNDGEFAKQSPIIRVARIDPLRVEVVLPVAMLGRVKVGTSAEILPAAPIGGVFGARVTVVDRVIDAASGTFGIRLALPNPDLRLPAGLKCRVRFNTR